MPPPGYFCLLKERGFSSLLAKTRLPAMYPRKAYVDEGGLMAYEEDPNGLDTGAPLMYVDKILKGTEPADIPVEQAKKFEFVINLKTAKQIGLAVSAERASAGE